MKGIADPDEYAKWLDSEESPVKGIITPENSMSLKLLRDIKKAPDSQSHREVKNG
jgi:hypothetical protein